MLIFYARLCGIYIDDNILCAVGYNKEKRGVRMEYREKYQRELKKRYESRGEIIGAIIRANTTLGMSKGAEHFLSDLHGEHEALTHILKSASGLIRERIDRLYGSTVSEGEREELATLIYYPKEKLDEISERRSISSLEYYTLYERMLGICRAFSEKYSDKDRKERVVRGAGEYREVVGEMLAAYTEGRGKRLASIYECITSLGAESEICIALSDTVRRLSVDRVHIVGDIFDRGPRADLIIDSLMSLEAVDIQWGNHDALWIGASLGIGVCVATAVHNCLSYANTELLEIGYGISLRPLQTFAEKIYKDADTSIYAPKGAAVGVSDTLAIARMNKAISVIRFKLEGAAIERNPEFMMEDRAAISMINKKNGTVNIGGKDHALRDRFFPTLKEENPLGLSEDESAVILELCKEFRHSSRLSEHIKFIVGVGSTYLVYNNNLCFHGGIPMTEGGDFMSLSAFGYKKGKALMDAAEELIKGCVARKEFSISEGDLIWFLWCGRNSPLSARERTAAFERLLIEDESTHKETRNAYYKAWQSEGLAIKILKEFGLTKDSSRIINGHIPTKIGENPIKAGGRLIVIDGGFCRAYQPRTGIGGYTLTYNERGMKLWAHRPFAGKESAIRENSDIISEPIPVYERKNKLRVRETDRGADLRDEIADFMELLEIGEGKV